MEDTRSRSLRRTALVGLIGGAALLVLGLALSFILSAAGALVIVVIGAVLIADRARAAKRWRTVWWAGTALVVGTAGAVMYGELWAVEFDLADAGRPIPHALQLSSVGSGLAAVTAVAVFLVLAVRALPRGAAAAE